MPKLLVLVLERCWVSLGLCSWSGGWGSSDWNHWTLNRNWVLAC